MAVLQVEVKTNNCGDNEVYKHLIAVGDDMTDEQQLAAQYRIIEAIQTLYAYEGVRYYILGEPDEDKE